MFYIVGGRGRYGDLSKILKWEAEVWSHVGDLQHPRHGLVLAMNGDQLLIMCGWSTTFTDNQATLVPFKFKLSCLKILLSDIEIWDFESTTTQVDDELSQSLAIHMHNYFYIAKIDEPASCSGEN